MNKRRIRLKASLFVLLTTPAMLCGQSSINGIWKVKDVKSLKGQNFVNGLPTVLKLGLIKSKIQFEITESLGDRDSTYILNLSLGKNIKNYSVSASGRRRTISAYWDSTSNCLKKETITFQYNDSLDAERRSVEEIKLNGESLTIVKTSAKISGSDDDKDYSMVGVYEKITPDDFARETAKGKGIKFIEGMTWENILAKAKKENKIIFVDCYATWCGPCKIMDRNVFSLNAIGDAVSQRFLSVKVQMDTGKNDNSGVKQMYSAARTLEKKYGIVEVPTYMFFSPQGKAIHKAVGQMKPTEFHDLLQTVTSRPGDQLYTLISNAKEKRIGYEKFPALIKRIKTEFNETELARDLAHQFKNEYLLSLPENELLQKKYWDFISSFPSLITPSDPFFNLCYEKPTLVENIIGYKSGGWADYQVRRSLTNAYIKPVISNRKLWRIQPNWDSLEHKIGVDFNTNIAKIVILDSRISFYESEENWSEYFHLLPMQIASHDHEHMLDIMQLNSGAWNVFLFSEDTALMNKAISWTNIAIGRTAGGIFEEMVKDTKAWLLYKLGRKDESITLMNSMARLYPEDHHNRKVIENMLSWMKQGVEAWKLLAEQERKGQPNK